MVPEESGQRSALERLATAIESEVADRKAERKRHEEAQQREAALLSALLLFIISFGFTDIMIGDPLSKGFSPMIRKSFRAHGIMKPSIPRIGRSRVEFHNESEHRPVAGGE